MISYFRLITKKTMFHISHIYIYKIDTNLCYAYVSIQNKCQCKFCMCTYAKLISDFKFNMCTYAKIYMRSNFSCVYMQYKYKPLSQRISINLKLKENSAVFTPLHQIEITNSGEMIFFTCHTFTEYMILIFSLLTN